MKKLQHSIFTLCINFALLSGCTTLQSPHPQDTQLNTALQEYARAKSTSAHTTDPDEREHLTRTRLTYIHTALERATAHQRAGEWFQAQQLLDGALKHTPDSQQLKDARDLADTELTTRLRSNDCQLGAARASYLNDKVRLLELRSPLGSKDYLQDWKSTRERQELEQLAMQLRDCANAALDDNQTLLAELCLNAAEPIHGATFIAAEQQRYASLTQPTKVAPPPTRKPLSDSPQQRARKANIALQSAMTRGDLRQAKTQLTALRKLSGDTEPLLALDKSVSDAINAYISETHSHANALYRDQEIEAARDLWQKILELDPDDTQARSNLERAERVLKKIDELQGNVTPEVTP